MCQQIHELLQTTISVQILQASTPSKIWKSLTSFSSGGFAHKGSNFCGHRCGCLDSFACKYLRRKSNILNSFDIMLGTSQ